jgi:hypothetical protein
MLADRPHGRRLTAAEQTRLDQLARRLREDDPDLAAALSGPETERQPRSPDPAPRWALVVGLAATATVLVLLGAAVGGVSGGLAVVVPLVGAFFGWFFLGRHRRLRP